MTDIEQVIEFCECPPGLFTCKGGLFFKSEYGDDAYCVSTGEIFWGGTQTKEDRAKLIVHPIEYETAENALRQYAAMQNPEPLTTEQLREHNGMPVFLHTFSSAKRITRFAEWVILDAAGNVVDGPDGKKFGTVVFSTRTGYKRSKIYADYGKTYLVYDHPPKDMEAQS